MSHDPKMVEMVARAYQDTADAMTVDEWQLDPRDCERRCATAALDALAKAGRLVPEGWKLVPMNRPTRTMRWATWEAQYRHTNVTRGHNADEETIFALTTRRVDDPEQEAQDRAAYRAMLSAAPRAEDQA